MEYLPALIEAPRRAPGQDPVQQIPVDHPTRREPGRDVQHIQGTSRIPVRGLGKPVAQHGIEADPEIAQPAFPIGERPVDECFDVRGTEWFQHIELEARQQCPGQLERRVLGRGADEDQGAVLDIGQEGVLLALVEAMHLVDE